MWLITKEHDLQSTNGHFNSLLCTDQSLHTGTVPVNPKYSLKSLLSNVQVQSNALAALEAIDADVAEKVLAEGCVTGDRINGLCDGVSGHW